MFEEKYHLCARRTNAFKVKTAQINEYPKGLGVLLSQLNTCSSNDYCRKITGDNNLLLFNDNSAVVYLRLVCLGERSELKIDVVKQSPSFWR